MRGRSRPAPVLTELAACSEKLGPTRVLLGDLRGHSQCPVFHPSVHLFRKRFLSCYFVPGTMLRCWGSSSEPEAVHKSDTALPCPELLVGERRDQGMRGRSAFQTRRLERAAAAWRGSFGLRGADFRASHLCQVLCQELGSPPGWTDTGPTSRSLPILGVRRDHQWGPLRPSQPRRWRPTCRATWAAGAQPHSPPTRWQGTLCRGPFRRPRQRPRGCWDPRSGCPKGLCTLCQVGQRPPGHWEPPVLGQLLPSLQLGLSRGQGLAERREGRTCASAGPGLREQPLITRPLPSPGACLGRQRLRQPLHAQPGPWGRPDTCRCIHILIQV